jgi:activating signal cointegrator 1
VKALTLTEPWASLVACRQKLVETRSWYTAYRGPLAIHAAKGFPKWAREESEENPIFKTALTFETGSYNPELTRGRVLCLVELVDVKRTEDVRLTLSAKELEFGDYHAGRFAWFLKYINPYASMPLAKGALGLWEWTHSV